jgi:hypothetical protein
MHNIDVAAMNRRENRQMEELTGVARSVEAKLRQRRIERDVRVRGREPLGLSF